MAEENNASILDQSFDLVKFGIGSYFDAEREEAVQVVDSSRQVEANLAGGIGQQGVANSGINLSLTDNTVRIALLGVAGLLGLVLLSKAL